MNSLALRLSKILVITLLFALPTLTLASKSNETLKKNSKYGVDCKKHQIYCHILKNKPKINKAYAMKLSNVIYKKSKKHNINPFLFSGIIAQESYYKLNATNCVFGITKKSDDEILSEIRYCLNGFSKDDNCIENINNNKEIKICTDFGLTQIHYRTAKRYNFEIKKLTTDMEYAVEAGMIVLKDFQKRYAKKEFYWWTRYNTSNPTKREIYRQLVDRFL